MDCHKPGHRAPARCASVLLAAGALLATAADRVDGPSEPAFGLAAVGIPQPGGQEAAAVPPGPEQRKKPAPATRPKKAAVKKPASKKPPVKKASVKKASVKKAPPKKAVAKKAPPKKAVAKKAAPKKTNPMAHLPAAANPKAAKAVSEALSLIGVPYRWGGTTRAGGFDCSGFTQHVWAAAGVKIPRTVRAQAAAGTPIPLSKAQPGDLVVFYPSRHHVGVYIGNGLVVDSPHSGSHVRTDPVRSMPVSIVVRPRG